MKKVLALLSMLLCACQAASSEHAVVTHGSRAELSEEIGSARNARVAIERTRDREPLTFFASTMSDEQLAELERSAPDLRIVRGLSREDALARAHEADGIDARYATSEFLREAPNVRWVQALSAGVDRYMDVPELVNDPRIVFTNLRGVHGPAIADHVFAMLLALTRDLPVQLQARMQGEWKRDGSSELTPIALQGRTLLVVGLGGIGTEVARRAHGFGMHVIATRRGDDPAPEFVERVGKPQDLHAFLALADVVVLCVPLTSETEHMLDARAFAACKQGAWLVNIARGRVVDTQALVTALDSGRLAGACLDVTDPEPLPSDHPLWRRANVVITPHVASDAALTDERGWMLLRENLRRFDAGEPLLNVVDVRLGY